MVKILRIITNMMLVQKTSALLIFIFGLHICKGGLDTRNLGDYIRNSDQRSLNSMENLGPSMEKRLASLNNNLGDSISRQVYEGLKPVRILESIVKVTHGTDGTTIATFSPNNKKLIIRDGIFYECDGGSISDENGSCSGTLKRYSFEKREDFCYSSTKSRINNWYCLSVGNCGVSTNIINGEISCNGGNNPTLLITVDEYKTLCENVARSVRYKYFTNNKIQEFGNGLTCTGDKPQICTFSSTINNNDNINTVLPTSDEGFPPNSGPKTAFWLTFSLQLLFSVIFVLFVQDF